MQNLHGRQRLSSGYHQPFSTLALLTESLTDHGPHPAWLSGEQAPAFLLSLVPRYEHYRCRLPYIFFFPVWKDQM